MHLVGFTIEIFWDARPYERQICILPHLSVSKSLKYFNITSDFTALIVHFCDTGP